MSQYHDLARVLCAAGGARNVVDGSTELLYTDTGTLTYANFDGDKKCDEAVIEADVRAGSPACYLYVEEPDHTADRFILYADNMSLLRSSKYDEEEMEWYTDTFVPQQQLHPEGNLAACHVSGTAGNKVYIFYQDPSTGLMGLVKNGGWSPFVTLAEPVVGSPISVSIVDDRLHVFYISRVDDSIHYLLEADGSWVDHVLSKTVTQEPIVRLMVGKDDEIGKLEAYALTTSKGILRAAEGGELREIGRVNKAGKFVASTSQECGGEIHLNIVKEPKSFRFELKLKLPSFRRLCW